MTQRAKRMQKALEAFGWETGERWEYRRCDCGTTTSNEEDKHCRQCGAKLPKPRRAPNSTREQLESAIAYALGEVKLQDIKDKA